MSTVASRARLDRIHIEKKEATKKLPKNNRHIFSGFRNRGAGNMRYVARSSAFSPFGGRLTGFTKAWTEITRDPWVLNTVAFGLHTDFLATAGQYKIPDNAATSAEHSSIIDQEIKSLLMKGAIEKCKVIGFVSPFFIVPKSTGTWRPIINLRALDNFIPHHHFKMEGVNTVRHMIRPGDWLGKVDLKDAYFTVALDKRQRQFFQFRWRKQLYQYISMPFGLNLAPWAFRKLLKPVISGLRQRGIRIVNYLDDILIMAHSEKEVHRAFGEVLKLITTLGFVIHSEKSVLIPTQRLEYLGLVIDTVAMTFSLPLDKRTKLLGLCGAALGKKATFLRELAAILGLLNWAVQTVNFAPAHFRALQHARNKSARLSDDLSSRVHLPAAAREDLNWWLTKADYTICRPIIASPPSLTIFSDASLTGWGAS